MKRCILTPVSHGLGIKHALSKWVSKTVIIRNYVSYLLIALIALQSSASIADTYSFVQSETVPFTVNLNDTFEADRLSAQDSESGEALGCYHGCHCQIYLSVSIALLPTHIGLETLTLVDNSTAPEVPVSSLLRPPII